MHKFRGMRKQIFEALQFHDRIGLSQFMKMKIYQADVTQMIKLLHARSSYVVEAVRENGEIFYSMHDSGDFQFGRTKREQIYELLAKEGPLSARQVCQKVGVSRKYFHYVCRLGREKRGGLIAMREETVYYGFYGDGRAQGVQLEKIEKKFYEFILGGKVRFGDFHGMSVEKIMAEMQFGRKSVQRHIRKLNLRLGENPIRVYRAKPVYYVPDLCA